jgi:hypothetical protein
MYAINKADMDDVIKPLEENSEHVELRGRRCGRMCGFGRKSASWKGAPCTAPHANDPPKGRDLRWACLCRAGKMRAIG